MDIELDDVGSHGPARIKVLLWADLIANHAVWVMMTYLTDVWQLSPIRAAAILNIWNGISKALPMFFALFLGFLGNFRVLLISSFAYTIGLGLLTISTPSVSGPCSELKRECIGYMQKVLFYTSLALISVGIAGHFVSLKPFMDEKVEEEEETNNDNEEVAKNAPTNKDQAKNGQDIKTEQVDQNPQRKKEDENKVFHIKIGNIVVVIISMGGGVVLQSIKPWSLRFGLPAIFTLISTLVFSTLLFSKSYKFSSQDIQATMISLRMVPILLTFIICGLVLSVGNTYFLEQANTMSRNLGSIKVPLTVLLLFYSFMKSLFRAIYTFFAYTPSKTSSADVPNEGGEEGEGPAAEKKELRSYAPPICIGIAMIFSILCCITAARIEKSRLNVISNHGLSDKPNETVPMTFFKLLPQFLLLAAFDGVFGKSAVDFFTGQGLEKLSNIFIVGMSGVGVMSGALSVYIVGKVSERGGRRNWFQESLSDSRLDRYYWTLAALSAVNLVVYIFVACYCYSYRKVEVGDEEGEGGEGPVMPEEENALLNPKVDEEEEEFEEEENLNLKVVEPEG